MNSPPHLQLQGASRVTGGFAHGRALGNIFNLADAQDLSVDDLGPMMGKLFLYFSNDDPGLVDLARVKPSGTMKCAVSPTVGHILKMVGRKFSPIQGK